MAQYTGKTVEEALNQARQQLGVADDQLVTKVVQQSRRGFLGIGRRLAIVEVKMKKPMDHQSVQAVTKQRHSSHKANSQQLAAQKESKPASVSRHQNDEEIDPAEMKRRHEQNVQRVKNSAQELVQYLQEVCAQLQITVKPVIKEIRSHEVVIDLQSEQSGRIIGHHGRRINALEQISNAFMNYHGAAKTIVILDTADYRERRRQALHTLAERSVTEVVATGQAVFLDPMPARERKQLHQELENNRHVRTYSHGREPYRSVVIAPAN